MTLPRFKIEFEAGMVPLLQKLGISSLFTMDANLKEMADEPLYGQPHLLLKKFPFHMTYIISRDWVAL